VRSLLGLPELVLDLQGLPNRTVHLARAISSLRFPHRNADAYLRDSALEGVEFTKTEIGRAIFRATADDPAPLLSWLPQALLFGFWQSHLGKKGPRSCGPDRRTPSVRHRPRPVHRSVDRVRCCPIVGIDSRCWARSRHFTDIDVQGWSCGSCSGAVVVRQL